MLRNFLFNFLLALYFRLLRDTQFFIYFLVLICGLCQLASEPCSWGCGGLLLKLSWMEARIKNLERKMDEVEQLLKGQCHTQTRGQSPPQREHRKMEMEDRWDGKERCSPPYSKDRFLRHGEGFSWGSRPPECSQNRGHPRHHDDGQRRATIDRGDHQTERATMRESSRNKEGRTWRERKGEPWGCD